MKFSCMLLVAVVLLWVGCSRSSTEDPELTWRELAVGSFTPEQSAQKDEAMRARSALFRRLLTTLQQVIQKDGPVAAIEVCRGEAPRLAGALARERNLRIGRTSFRLRNPANRPPLWAENLVRDRAAEPRFLAGPDGTLGAFLPIRLKSQCVMCHGPEDAVSPELKHAILAAYPEDRATGFSTDDLRGWFWIEVPPRRGHGS